MKPINSVENMFVVNIVEWIVFLYFGFATWYLFFFSLAGLWGYSSKGGKLLSKRRYAVLIPGYKEDEVIVEVAQNATFQDFPKEQYEIVIIADSFRQDTLSKLAQLPVRVVEFVFQKSTKSKALRKGMEAIGDDFDVAVVLDADNIMAVNFLAKIDHAFSKNYEVVQGHRVAKNLNTPVAILDAISEEINNHIFRRGHRVVGLSSALIGSGMAFRYSLFKSMMSKIHAVGGFDKELELKLLRDKKVIEYVDDAIVYDEKVQKKEAFQRQRTRWLSAQFIYFRRFALSGFQHLLREKNIDFFDKVYQMIVPPRIIHLGVIATLTLLYALIGLIDTNGFTLSGMNYFGLLCLTTLSFTFSIPRKLFVRLSPKIVLEIPKLFAIMVLSLFKLKGANKSFIHTAHGSFCKMEEKDELKSDAKKDVE